MYFCAALQAAALLLAASHFRSDAASASRRRRRYIGAAFPGPRRRYPHCACIGNITSGILST